MTFLQTPQCLAVVPAFNEEKAIADVGGGRAPPPRG